VAGCLYKNATEGRGHQCQKFWAADPRRLGSIGAQQTPPAPPPFVVAVEEKEDGRDDYQAPEATDPEKRRMIRLKRPQAKVFRSKARFRVLVRDADSAKRTYPRSSCVRRHGGRVVWPGTSHPPTNRPNARLEALKELTRPYWASKPNETDLRSSSLPAEPLLYVEPITMTPCEETVLISWSSMNTLPWHASLDRRASPGPGDKLGRALFIGTPQGYNHFFDLYEAAEKQSDWERFQFTTEDGGNVPQQEIEAAP